MVWLSGHGDPEHQQAAGVTLKNFTSMFRPPPLLFLIDDQVTTGEENDMQQWFKLYLSQEIIHHTAWIQSI